MLKHRGRKAVIVAAFVHACGGDDADVAVDTETTESTGATTTAATVATNDTADSSTTDDSGTTDEPSTTEGGPLEVTLDGGIQKGPLVIGSTLEVALLDASGNATGQVFPTVTTSDLGEFEVSFMHSGPVALVGDGYYYNELTGAVSAGTINLRALHTIATAGTQSAFVNLLTHLAERRAIALLASNDVETAIAQAEQELVAALGIGPAGTDPGGAAIDMNLLGGDSIANAYLFATSAIMVQAAAIEAGPDGSIDESLQAFINALADDLADDGALEPARVQLLDDAERALYTDRTFALLADRLADLGIQQAPPNLDLVVDTDADDVANAMDSCPWVANPRQLPVLDQVCHARAEVVVDAEGAFVGEMALGDLDSDGNIDVVARSATAEWLFFAGDGAGNFSLAHQENVATDATRLVDVNDDGVLDVVLEAGNGTTAVHLREDGFDPLPSPILSASAYEGYLANVFGDLNGDDLPEFFRIGGIGASGSGDAELPLMVLVNDGAGGFVDGSSTVTIPMGTSFSGPIHNAVADVTGDGDLDYVVLGRSLEDLPLEDIVAIAFPGDGSGNLGAAIVSSAPAIVGGDPGFAEIRIAEVTGDAILDIVSFTASSVLCMPGNGDGTFGPDVTTDIGIDLNYALWLAAGDFTGDDVPDILIRRQPNPHENLDISVIPSLGDGTFGAASSRVSGLLRPENDGVSWAAAADFDGNGADDVFLSSGTLAATMMFTPDTGA